MPMTVEEVADLAKRVAAWILAVADNPDEKPGPFPWHEGMTEDERREVHALARYELDSRLYEERRRAAIKPQRRACRLLRSFLNPEQREQLRRNRYFTVVGSAGGIYRLIPETGSCARIEKHGTRWYAVMRYCFHDPDRVMPPADVTLGQMLHLLHDEPGFLAAANANEVLDQFWNGEYLRRIRRRRLADQENPVAPPREEAA